MKKYKIFFLFAVLGANSLFAKDVKSEDNFEYDKSKNQTGTANFYKISNLDKNQNYELAIYQDSDKIFVSMLDVSNISPQLVIETQQFNSKYFCYDYQSDYNPFAYAKIANTNVSSEIIYDLEKLKAKGSFSGISKSRKVQTISGKLDLVSVPAYEISGYQTGLWHAMRFIKNDCSTFKVCAYTALKAYEEKVKYIREEEIKGKLCDKWEASILNKKGNPSNQKQIFWFEKDDAFYRLVQSEVHMKDCPFNNTLIEFIGSKEFTGKEWSEFVNQKVESVRVKLNIPAQK